MASQNPGHGVVDNGDSISIDELLFVNGNDDQVSEVNRGGIAPVVPAANKNDLEPSISGKQKPHPQLFQLSTL